VKSVIGLAQDLQIGVVAEGVETADQLEYLRQTNCDEVQGYLIGRPEPIAHYRHVVTGVAPPENAVIAG